MSQDDGKSVKDDANNILKRQLLQCSTPTSDAENNKRSLKKMLQAKGIHVFMQSV